MTLIFDAVFEKGVFRPLGTLQTPILEGQAVRLTVEAPSPDDILKLAGQVYEGLSPEQIDTVERIALDRRNWFGQDPAR